jgi:hypothetical protein
MAAFTVIMRKKANDTKHAACNDVGIQRCKQGGRADRKRHEDTRKVATSAFLSPRRGSLVSPWRLLVCLFETMMSRIALSRTFSTRLSAASNRLTYAARSFGTINESPSATDAWKASCYMEIDFTISDQAYAIEAIQKFAAFDIGCLITTDEDGACSSLCSLSPVFSSAPSISKMEPRVKTHLTPFILSYLTLLFS